ncbi:MAG: V-type ATP synthase subunit F, partial [Anaerolineales bacterium]
MKQLLIVTKPDRAVGFLLAGVTAHEATDAASARQVIEQWVERGERGLLAIDSELAAGLEASFMNWLE